MYEDRFQRIFESTLPSPEGYVYDYDYMMGRFNSFCSELDHRLFVVHVKDNEISITYPLHPSLSGSQLNFRNNFFSIMERFRKWLKDNNQQLPNTTMLFESIQKKYNIDNKRYPAWFMSSVEEGSLIFPFFSVLFHATTTVKTETKFASFDSFKEQIIKNSVQDWNEKLNISYFKGSANTLNKHAIRELTRNLTSNNSRFNVDTDENTFEPFWNSSRYKFVLNLPGSNTWSYREILIPYVRSIMITLEVHTYSFDGNFLLGRTVSSFNGIYNQLKTKKFIFFYYLASTPEEKRIVFRRHRLQIYRFINFVQRTMDFYLSHPEIAKREIDHNFKVMMNLNEERIYQYIYRCFEINSMIENGQKR